MSPAEVAACVSRTGARGRCLVEVFGGVTLDTVAAYADAGADLISVGALTHSAPALDIGLDLPTRVTTAGLLLAIDAGNTQTVLGLYAGARARSTTGGSPPTLSAHPTSTPSSSPSSSTSTRLGFDDVTGMVVAVHRPPPHGCAAGAGGALPRFPPVVLEPGTRSGMPILYDNPKQVGPDRIANAVAAFDLYGGPVIVVDFGTATTIDATSAAGEYLGGAILPGIEVSLDALIGRAAALYWVDLVKPRRVIGKSTTESVQSGVLYGFAAGRGRPVPAVPGRAGGLHRGVHRWPGRARGAAVGVHRGVRAVADPPRPAARSTTEILLDVPALTGRSGPRPALRRGRSGPGS